VTPAELPAYLAAVRAKLQEEGPPKVAYAMARTFHKTVSDETLVRYSHTRGTFTPSPPGEPPAIVGGALKRSLRLYPAIRTGPSSAQSKVVPLIKYARIQELGGTVHAQDGLLHWKTNGKDHYASSVTLPPRPYMRPTHRKTIEDGRLRNAAIEALKGLVP